MSLIPLVLPSTLCPVIGSETFHKGLSGTKWECCHWHSRFRAEPVPHATDRLVNQGDMHCFAWWFGHAVQDTSTSASIEHKCMTGGPDVTAQRLEQANCCTKPAWQLKSSGQPMPTRYLLQYLAQNMAVIAKRGAAV